MPDATAIRIESEDEAWEYLRRALAGDLPDDLVPAVAFKGWPHVSVYLPDTPIEASISPQMMRALVELQDSIYRAHSAVASGKPTARLSQAPLFELRQHLAAAPPALQSACGSAGVLLEAVCDYLTALYECDVPRRKGKLTLGDMLPKVADKKLAEALRVEIKQPDGTYTMTALGDKLVRLRELAQLRNIFGCHYNELAHVLPQKDAQNPGVGFLSTKPASPNPSTPPLGSRRASPRI